MDNQYADSDSDATPICRERIRIQYPNVANLREMPPKSPRPPAPAAPPTKEFDPTSRFIRFLIAEYEEGGGKLKDLAAKAGLAKSMPSQIKARTSGASFYSAAKFARVFGYRDLAHLVAAAAVWAQQEDQTKRPSGQETPREEAVRLALGYGLTVEQIDRVLSRLPSPDFDNQDALWWLARFHEERSLDDARAGQEKAQRYVETDRARTQKLAQDRIRNKKEQLKEARREEAATSASPARHRHRAS